MKLPALRDRFRRLIHHEDGVEMELIGWDGYPRKVRVSHEDSIRIHKALNDGWEERLRASRQG